LLIDWNTQSHTYAYTGLTAVFQVNPVGAIWCAKLFAWLSSVPDAKEMVTTFS